MAVEVFCAEFDALESKVDSHIEGRFANFERSTNEQMASLTKQTADLMAELKDEKEKRAQAEGQVTRLRSELKDDIRESNELSSETKDSLDALKDDVNLIDARIS